MRRWWKERRITRLRREHADVARRGATAIHEWRHADEKAILRLERANLAKADLSGSDLSRCRLDQATLNGARLVGADLSDAVLRHASLRHADLRDVRGLTPAQLAGCDLTGAHLPPSIDAKELATAAQLGEAAGYTRHLFLWMIGSCAFCLITIAAMPICQLLMSGGHVKLPILGASVPTSVFFYAAPAILLGVYYYFHLSLQRLWERLAMLPAVFPDGEPIDRKTHGWLMFGFVRRRMPRLRDRPAMFRTQTAVNVLAAYGSVPLVVLAIWWRYALRHDWNRSVLHLLAVSVAVFLAIGFYALATGTLRGRKRYVLLWSRYALAFGMLYGLQEVMEKSYHGDGVRGFYVVVEDEDFSERPEGWRAKAAGAELDYLATLRKELHTPAYMLRRAGEADPITLEAFRSKHREAYAAVKGARLSGVDLANGWMRRCFLAHADLSESQWRRSENWSPDLSYASLSHANLEDARLMEAWFIGASFVDANMSGVKFWAVVGVGADFRNAFLYGAETATHADFREARFDRANLCEVQFQAALLDGASLNRADAQDAQFNLASLEGATFVGADLRGASFEKANLAQCDFTDAVFGIRTPLQGREPGEPTNFCGTDLSTCRGLSREQMQLAVTDAGTQWPHYLLDLPRHDQPQVVVLPKLALDEPASFASAKSAEQASDLATMPGEPTEEVADGSENPLRPGTVRR